MAVSSFDQDIDGSDGIFAVEPLQTKAPDRPSLNLLVYCSVVSDFRRNVGDICAVLGYYAASSGLKFSTFEGLDRCFVPQRQEGITTVLTYLLHGAESFLRR